MITNKLKRCLSGLLAALMLVTLLPTSAWATTTASGTCGNNLTWTLDSEGTLTISGTGEMEDYKIVGNAESTAPWSSIGTSIRSVVLTPGVTGIGDQAFYYCNRLLSVSIPDTVTRIGYGAFYCCSLLSDITLPNSITDIGEFAFYECSNLTGVTIPGGVSAIPSGAFAYCYKLSSVTLSDGLTSIGDSAFQHCDKLTAITIPDSVTWIGAYAFHYCGSLSDIHIGSGVTVINSNAFARTAYAKNTDNWQDGILYLDGYLLDADEDITTASLRSGTKVIAGSAFADCGSLTGVTLPNGLTHIGSSAFADCYSLTGVTLPDSVTTIGDMAFNGCSRLSSIRIGSGVTYMGYYAFDNTAYTNNDDNWTNGLLYLGAYLIGSREDITAVSLPGGTKLIASNALAYCGSLTSVTMPDSLKYINTAAFVGCASLTDVYYGGTEAQWKKIVIEDLNDELLGATIHYNNAATPAAPKVSSSIVTSTGKIKLTWSAVDGAAKYYIYRSTDGGKTYSYYTSTTSTSWTNKSVTPGTKYYYKIKAICSNTEGNSAYSNAVYRTADCAKPSLSSSIVSSSGAIKLSWSKVTGATKYYIYRSTDGTNFSYYDSTTKLSYTNTGAKSGTTYYYKVKAVCAKSSYGNSAYSNIVSIKSK